MFLWADLRVIIKTCIATTFINDLFLMSLHIFMYEMFYEYTIIANSNI